MKPIHKISYDIKLIYFLFIAIFLCSSCSKQPMPLKKDIDSYLVQSLSRHRASLDYSEILAAENVGDKVEPAIKMRVKSIWIINKELYFEAPKSRLLNKKVYAALDMQGVKTEIYDIVIATQKGEEWTFHKSIESINAIDPRKHDKGYIENYFSSKVIPKRELLTMAEIPESAIIYNSDKFTQLINQQNELEKRENVQQNELEKRENVQLDMKFDNKEYAMTLGQNVYNRQCAACHQANGKGIPGVFPGLSGSMIATGNIDDLVDLVVNGKAGTAMQAFGLQLNNEDIAAVATYVRNSWNNNMGDIVKPSIVPTPR